MARISYDDPWKLYPRSALYYTSDGASITSSTGTPYLCLSRKDLWDLLSNMLKFNLTGLSQEFVIQLALGLHTFHVIVWRVYFKMGRWAQKILLFQAGHNSAWPWAWQPRVSDLVSFERRWQQCWMYRDRGKVRRPSRCVHYKSLCTSACVKLLKVFESASEKRWTFF